MQGESTSAKEKVYDNVQANLSKMEARSSSEKWTCHSVVHQIQQRIPKLYTLTEQVKAQLIESLKSTFRVCHCHGEADTHIAALMKAESTVIVTDKEYMRIAVSSDSDFLAYDSIEQVLWKNPGILSVQKDVSSCSPQPPVLGTPDSSRSDQSQRLWAKYPELWPRQELQNPSYNP